MTMDNSNFSGRSRPRLVKVRKHTRSQQGRSTTTTAADTGPDLNQIRPVLGDSVLFEDATVASNGLGASVCDDKFGDFANFSSVFGATKGNLASNLSSQQLDAGKSLNLDGVDFMFGASESNLRSNSNLEQSTADDFRNFNNFNSVLVDKIKTSWNMENKQDKENTRHSGANESFVFGATNTNMVPNSNLEHIESNKPAGHSGAYKFGNYGNLGSFLDANKSNLVTNPALGNRERVESASNSSSNEFVKFDNIHRLFGANILNLSSEKSGFVVGCKLDISESSSNSEIREPNKNDGNFNRETGQIKEDSRKNVYDDLGVGASHGDSKSNSSFGTQKCCENVQKLATELRGEMKPEHGANAGRPENISSVFGQSWSGLWSNSNLNREKREFDKDEGKPIFVNNEKMKSGAQLRKLGNEVFVFGGSDLASCSNFEKRESSGCAGESVPLDGVKTKATIEKGYQRAKHNGEFIFGCSNEKVSVFVDVTKLNHEMNKVTSSGNCNGFAKSPKDTGGSIFDVNSKSHFVFGCNTNAARDFEANPVNRLSESMKKLNVDKNGNIGSEKAEDSTISSNAKDDKMFVFAGQNKASVASSGNSATTSCDKNLDCEGPLNGGTVENTDEINLKTSDFVFASNRGNARSNGGCVGRMMHKKMKKRTTKSWFPGAFEKQRTEAPPSVSSAKERQPSTIHEQSTDDPSVGIAKPNLFTFQAGLSKNTDGSQDQFDDVHKLKEVPFPSFSSIWLNREAPSAGKVENKKKLSSTSMPDLQTPSRDAAFSFTTNPLPGSQEQLQFSAKARSIRDRRLKNTGGKLRQSLHMKQRGREGHLSKERSSQQTPDANSPGGYSPMDFSPYQDNYFEPSGNSNASANAKDKDLAASKDETDTIEEKKCGGPTEKGSRNCSISSPNGCPSKEFVAGSGIDTSSNGEENQHNSFASNSVDTDERNFTFSASPAQDSLLAAKRQGRKKYKMKIGHGSTCTTPSRQDDFAPSSAQFSPFSGNSSQFNSTHVKNGAFGDPGCKMEHKYREDKEHVKQESAVAAMEEACEKWRIRGNEAYKNRYLSKAEEFYTNGINSVPQSKAFGCYLEPLVLCYSNRAATRMSLGRMREALGDCTMAAALDPNFIKIHIRAANCHLALGEVEDARQYYNKCLELGSNVCLDRRIIIEAADGLQKAQKVAECTSRCAELLQQKSSDGANKALGIIAEVLSLSFYSEKLLEMKGEALLMLRKYEEVIQLCEQTLDFAEKNFTTTGFDNEGYTADSKIKNPFLRLWRWRLMSKCYFLLGRLEVALDLLEKFLGSTTGRSVSTNQGSSISLAATVRELLDCKNSGNKAFQSGRHTEAVEHYTAAISSSIESRPFTAICFCNRAAASQALGQITDAIADCSLAIALDGNYQKAVSRRANLHETIRDYEQAVSDLQRLISILEKQSEEKVQQSNTPDRSTGCCLKELRQAHRRLSSLEEKAKKRTSLDLYLILGVKASDTLAEVKKAYRKAALRHHPDKAGQFLARSETGDDGNLWKEIADEVHKDADRLFKMIGEAYAVLSDPTKRLEYDLEEEVRNSQQDLRKGSGGSRRPSDSYSSPFESSANRRYWQESWRTHGNSNPRW